MIIYIIQKNVNSKTDQDTIDSSFDRMKALEIIKKIEFYQLQTRYEVEKLRKLIGV